MNSVLDLAKRQSLGLLALLLVLGGGSAYAAKTHLPKNSVASKQVKNGSLQGKDLKDGSVTGADVGDGTVTGADVATGSISGTDLQDGTVGAGDLAPTAVPISRPVMAKAQSGGGPVVVYSDPLAGTITFGCGPGAIDMLVRGELPVSAQPGSVRVTAADIIDNTPVGASTISATVVQPTPYGTQFSGAAIIPQGTVFVDSASKRMSLDWDISGCVLRGLLVITDKASQPDVTPAAKGGPAAPECVEVGAAHCFGS